MKKINPEEVSQPLIIYPEEVVEKIRAAAIKKDRQARADAEAAVRPTSAHELLKTATSIVDWELTRLRNKALDRGLETKDHNSLKMLVGTLTEITQEERTLSKVNDLSKFSDEEILRQAEAALSAKDGVPPNGK